MGIGSGEGRGYTISLVYNRGMQNIDFILFYERYALERLAKHLGVHIKTIEHTSSLNASAKYDLLHEGTRYNVKMANPSRISVSSHVNIWDFDLRMNGYENGKNTKKNHISECDVIILLGFLHGVPKKVFLIPALEVGNTHIRIPLMRGSKYDKYAI